MNEDYLLDNFVDPHLRSANPQDPRNIFQFSDRVGYITNDNPDATRGPLPADDTAAPTTMQEATTAPNVTPGTPEPTVAGMTTPSPTIAPAPSLSPTPEVPKRKDAPPDKCGSLASNGGRGGAAAEAKDCVPRRLGLGGRQRRKLKGSSY